MTPTPAGQTGWLGRRTLRFRVLAAALGLVVLACLTLGLVTAFALRSFLLGQLDRRLVAAGSRYSVSHDADRDVHPDGDKGFGDSRGQAPGTLGVRIAGGAVRQSGVVGQAAPALSEADLRLMEGIPLRTPTSLDLGPVGDYRVVAFRDTDGDLSVIGLPLRPVSDTLAELAVVEAIVFGVVLLATAGGGLALIRWSLRPLARVTATAQEVSGFPLAGDGELPHRVPAPVESTEVGQLGVAFNRMLDHVDESLAARRESEGRLRRFIADASHELRTPVASIRAHAESLRRGEEQPSAATAVALQRIEAEAVRMGTLVDELLLLARLDSGRPLARDPVDLSRLAIDAADDARAAFPHQRWQLRLPAAPVTVQGDGLRLHQALSNLLVNAGKYTPAGTAVRIDLIESAEAVEMTVTDNGPGIPPERQGRLFERFYRGGNSGSAPGSHGLGLAIVQAVVHAHGGSVTLSSRMGHTSFRIRLPKQGTTPGADTADGTTLTEAGAATPEHSSVGQRGVDRRPQVEDQVQARGAHRPQHRLG